MHWKLEKFVKDYESQRRIEEIFFDKFYLLKACFIEMAAETAWPQLT